MKKNSYVIQDAEKSPTPYNFLMSILLQNGISPKTNSGYICFMVVLWDDYETNINVMFVWTKEWKMISN